MRSIFAALAPRRAPITSPDEHRAVAARLAEQEKRTADLLAESAQLRAEVDAAVKALDVEVAGLRARLDAIADRNLDTLIGRLHTETNALAADMRAAGIDAPDVPEVAR